MSDDIISFKPMKKPRPVYTVQAFSIIICAVALFLNSYGSSHEWGYLWSFQLIAFVAVVVFVNYTNRYLFCEFTYIIDRGNFIIGKRQGKRATQVCNLALSTAVCVESAVAFKAAKHRNITKRFSYTQNLLSKDVFVYVFEFNGERGAVFFEPDERFVSSMKSEIDAAKTQDVE